MSGALLRNLVIACAGFTAAIAWGMQPSSGAIASTQPVLTSPWSVMPGSDTGQINDFNAISCTRVDFCMAVGTFNQLIGPDAAEWNGTSWSDLPIPGSVSAGQELFGVSCADAHFCMAVGHDTSEPFTEQWDGASWSIVPNPTIPGASLHGVSCRSARFCEAVGYSGTGPLTEQWNGASWSLAPNAFTVPNSWSGGLSGVSCVSRVTCYAVGSNAGQTFIEQWDGSQWSMMTSPSPTPPQGSSLITLESVSCVSSTMCQAVGLDLRSYGNLDSLIENWNGSAWSIVSTQVFSELTSVSCFSRVKCVAVGSFAPVLTWDGTFWMASASAIPPLGDFSAVSCVAQQQCVGVGGIGIQTYFASASVRHGDEDGEDP